MTNNVQVLEAYRLSGEDVMDQCAVGFKLRLTVWWKFSMI